MRLSYEDPETGAEVEINVGSGGVELTFVADEMTNGVESVSVDAGGLSVSLTDRSYYEREWPLFIKELP